MNEGKKMVVPVEITERDIQTIRAVIGAEGYYDWTDPEDIGEAITAIIQNPLREMV